MQTPLNYRDLMACMAAGSMSVLQMPTMAFPLFSLKLVESPREHLVQLLNVAVSIEHALMVQYLFAAYSLDPNLGENDQERQMIGNWQSLILSVAKEEMGHWLAVQNVLCLLGEPIYLTRAHDPWDSNFQPLFRLERQTTASLARTSTPNSPKTIPGRGISPNTASVRAMSRPAIRRPGKHFPSASFTNTLSNC